MKKSRLLCATGILLLISSGCSLNARLYPLNDKAEPTGMLRADYFTTASGSASVTVKMPDGEVLLGHFTLLEEMPADFGSILTAGEHASADDVSDASISEDEYPGFGTLVGDRGTRMDCEFNRNSSGGGAGACLTSAGALYRLDMSR